MIHERDRHTHRQTDRHTHRMTGIARQKLMLVFKYLRISLCARLRMFHSGPITFLTLKGQGQRQKRENREKGEIVFVRNCVPQIVRFTSSSSTNHNVSIPGRYACRALH